MSYTTSKQQDDDVIKKYTTLEKLKEAEKTLDHLERTCNNILHAKRKEQRERREAV